MSFKESIREARLKSGLSQEKVGNAINRTRNAIKGYEEGISSPNPDQLVTLCKLFNTTPNDLLEFQQQNEEAKMKHSKLPWHRGGRYYTDCGAKYEAIMEPNGIDEVVGENSISAEDAAFIVKAVNNHYKLLSALKDLMESISGGKKECAHDFTCVCSWDKAMDAVKQAENQS